MLQKGNSDLDARLSGAGATPGNSNMRMRMLCDCVITCRDLREVMQRIKEFFAMLKNVPGMPEFDFALEGDDAVYRLQDYRTQRNPTAAAADLAVLAIHHRLFSWLIGERLPVAGRVEGSPSAAGGMSPDRFPFPLHFEQTCNGIVFPASYLERPVVRSYPELREFMDLYPWDSALAEGALEESDRLSFSQRVMAVFHRSMARHDNIPTVTDLALMFGLSVTTVRRRLALEATSVNALKESCRRSLAQEYLQHSTQTLDDIAAHLDYSDSATFSRAFKSWMGMAPADYRRRAKSS